MVACKLTGKVVSVNLNVLRGSQRETSRCIPVRTQNRSRRFHNVTPLGRANSGNRSRTVLDEKLTARLSWRMSSRLGVNTMIKNFLRDESGASAAEYALLLAIIGIGIVLASGTLRDAIAGAMNNTAGTINV